MLRIILTVLCLTIGLPALAATDGATLLSDADSSRVISSLVQPSTLFLFLCATVFAAWFGGVASGLIAAARPRRRNAAEIADLAGRLRVELLDAPAA